MNVQLAQNLPVNSRPIQRTIVDEQDLNTTTGTSQTTAETQANHTVFYALGAIVLIIIAIVVAAMLLQKK